MKNKLTVLMVSEILSVSPKTVYFWCDLRIIPHYRIGGSIRFDPEEIEEWMKSCKCAPLVDYTIASVTGSPRKGGKRNGAT